MPLLILLIGLMVAGGAYFFISRSPEEPADEDGVVEEVALLDVPLNERPVLELVPRSDGHWLDMTVSKLMIEEAEVMEYDLIYDLPDGRQQGVPGIVELMGKDDVQVELLLGSESSGKFRYDEGVESGTMTLSFRNEEGRLLDEFVSEFHLQTATDTLTSMDNEFEYQLDDVSDEYFVVHTTIGFPAGESVDSEPYAIFSSSEEDLPGTLSWDGAIKYWNGIEWTELGSSSAPGMGIFAR